MQVCTHHPLSKKQWKPTRLFIKKLLGIRTNQTGETGLKNKWESNETHSGSLVTSATENHAINAVVLCEANTTRSGTEI